MNRKTKIAFAVTAGLSLASPVHAAGYCYGIWGPAGWSNKTEITTQAFPSLAACRDGLGSAMYSHNIGCWEGYNPAQYCNPTGNGDAYPPKMPYPLPTTLNQLTMDCFVCDAPIGHGAWFTRYPKGGTPELVPATSANINAAVAGTRKGIEKDGMVSDPKCPGYPGWVYGNACN